MDEERLRQLATKFYQEMQTSEQLRAHVADHQRRSQRAQTLLSPERIRTLSEERLRELFFDTDAFGFWKDKEGEFKRRLQSAGLDGLRNALLELITRAERGLTPDDLKQVWEMGGLGTLLATELLTYRYPARYWTYSSKVTLPALKQLGDDVKASMPHGQKSDPYVYLALEPRMAQARQALGEAGFGEADTDNLLADIFLWWVNHGDKTISKPSVVHYWKISPGEGAQYWDEFGKRNIIAVGDWGWEGASVDLRRVGNREALQATLQRSGASGGALQHAIQQLWTFYREMRPGDLICAYGHKQILGLGEIVSDYTFQTDDFVFPHRRPVRWHSTEPIPVDGLSPELRKKIQLRQTIIPLSQSEFQKIQELAPPSKIVLPDTLLSVLRRSLSSRGLKFSDWQIATFYTALQTKGFVILSGISGTGKTKLAQTFAALLPQPAGEPARPEEQIVISVQPYMLKYGRLIIPKRATRLFDPPAPGETREVSLTFNGQSQTCRLVHAAYGSNDYLSLLLRGGARSWFTQAFAEGDTLLLEPQLDRENSLTGFLMLSSATGQEEGSETSGTRPGNWLFVSVRPDWRDSKSLLGYYNPLAGTYEWTEFLRFLLRAAQSYRAGDGLAWFVILDEMNLAHVEYYFADLLSVLESGRDLEGWTNEPLRLAYPDDAEGDLPPREVRLPPNLYVLGTVNVDETTHAFSPKVLDRAFTLELTEADFSGYPPETSFDQDHLGEGERRRVLENFAFGNSFMRIEKQAIAAYLGGHPEARAWLQKLNDLLRPHDLHFGYRVFDEIVSFLASADRNGLYRELGGAEAAFDAAVLMKVLPKFHGSRGKLEAPLRDVLAWCLDPDNPEMAALSSFESFDKVEKQLGELPYRCPQTAKRACRMLWALYTTGFAAFG